MSSHDDPRDARRRLDAFLRERFGPDLLDDVLGPIRVKEDACVEYDNAFLFVADTVKAMESGNIGDGLMSGAIVVPKDGSPVHWAPTAFPVATYLQEVAIGACCWSGTEVTYYGLFGPGRARHNPSGILRRRTCESRIVDEVFTRNLRWDSTDYFEKTRLGHNNDDPIKITAAEAADFVRRIRSNSPR